MAPPRRREGFEYRRSERLQQQREMRIFRETFDQQSQVDDAIIIDEDVHEASDTLPVPPAEVEVDFQETPQQMGRGVDRPTGWWKMRNGKFIRMSEMEDGHLRNTISMIQRASHSRGRLPSSDSYRELLSELRMREGRRQREEVGRVQSLADAMRRSEQRVNEIRQQEERRVLDAARVRGREVFLAQQSPAGRRLFNQMVGANSTPLGIRFRRLIRDGDVFLRTPRTVTWRNPLENGFYLNEETMAISIAHDGVMYQGIMQVLTTDARIPIPRDLQTVIDDVVSGHPPPARISRGPLSTGTVRAVGTRRLERLTRQQNELIRTQTFVPWPMENLIDGFYLDESSRSIFLAYRGMVTTLLTQMSDAFIVSNNTHIPIPGPVIEIIDQILDSPHSLFGGLVAADNPYITRTAAGAELNPPMPTWATNPNAPIESGSTNDDIHTIEARRVWLSNSVEGLGAPEPVLPTKGRRIKTK